MFKKLQRQIDRKKAGSQALKYRFDLHLESLEGLPPSVTECRVVWARGAKVQLSKLVTVQGGVAEFSQQLSQVATVFRTPQNQLEGKEYSLKVEVPTKGDASKMVTFGKAVVDIVQFVSFNSPPEPTSIPMPFKVGSSQKGTLKFLVRATMLKGYVADDGMTEVSGMTGLSSLSAQEMEQDLSGFDDEHDHSGASGHSGGGSASGRFISPRHPADPMMDPIPESPALEKRPGDRSISKGGVKAMHEVAAVTVTPKADGKAAVEIATLTEENAKLAEENARLAADLQSAESDVEKAKAKLRKYKEVKKENEDLKLQVKRLERATEQAAAVELELEDARGALAKVEDAGGLEDVLRLAAEASAAAAALKALTEAKDLAEVQAEEAAAAAAEAQAGAKGAALPYERRIRELEQELASQNHALESARSEQSVAAEGLREEAAELHKALDSAAQRSRDREAHLTEELSTVRKAADAKEEEVQRMNQDIQTLKGELQQAVSLQKRAEQEEERLLAVVDAMRAEATARQRAEHAGQEGLQEVVEQLRQQLREAEEGRRGAQKRLGVLEPELEQARAREEEHLRSAALQMEVVARLQSRLAEVEAERHAVEKDLASKAEQLDRLRAATSENTTTTRAEELEQELQALRQNSETLEKSNAELLERLQSLEEELAQEQGAGAETSKLKEIYDSRILGLKREVEEQSRVRAELEENILARVEEEVAKAVEKQAAKHTAEREKIRAQVKEMQLRAGEDLDLLESRLLEANAENGRLEKLEAEAKRESKRIMQEKLSLERELFSATDERSEMELEIRKLKEILSQSSSQTVDLSTISARDKQHALPVSFRGPVGDDSSDSISQDSRQPAASGVADEELMRVVSELALAKISIAEMQEEKIKLKRDLYKQKEKYMTVAAKMTKLETKLYGT